MEKKTIAIITVCDALNYGTHLQAYALYHILRHRYCAEVKVITNAHPSLSEQWMFIRSKRPVRAIKKILVLIKLRTFHKQMKLCRRDSCYDVAVVGSDELWNINNKKLVHDGLYVCEHMEASVYATYAVSCNGTSHQEFAQMYGDGALDKFPFLSVRDVSTKKLADSFHKECSLHLDPTFLFDFSSHISIRARDVLLVYGYFFTDEEIREICDFAHKIGKKMVSVGILHQWCDKYVACGPMEFVEYVAGAAYFITSTFHGCAIAMQMKANFAAYARDNNKVYELLEEFGLLGRNVSQCRMGNVFEEDIDYGLVYKGLDKKKKECFSYLDTVMECGGIARNEQ